MKSTRRGRHLLGGGALGRRPLGEGFCPGGCDRQRRPLPAALGCDFTESVRKPSERGAVAVRSRTFDLLVDEIEDGRQWSPTVERLRERDVRRDAHVGDGPGAPPVGSPGRTRRSAKKPAARRMAPTAMKENARVTELRLLRS